MIRAIVVDDEMPARERMKRLLEELSVTVVGEAGDGEHALVLVHQLSPDVVFLDIQMPSCSGLEAAARLGAPRPRVVFCTAFDQFAIDAFEHHAVDYLLKPVNRERLARTIGRLSAEIGSDRRAERERHDAAAVQARLMPQAAVAGGIEFAAVCRPADGVGGDYYDVLEMEEGRTALALGDVSGKGLYAGILAAAVQARLQTLCAGSAHDPASILAEVNRLTVGTLEEHRYVTLSLAVHDAAASTVTFANAGHPPAVLVSHDGTWRAVECPGAVIGWPGDSFASVREDVVPGDIVAMYSDGLTETVDPDDQELGTSGLAGLLLRHASLPVGAMVTAILAEVESYAAGAPPCDDRTLLLARIL